jgi:nucleotide-binding universal stress UspA family protein
MYDVVLAATDGSGPANRAVTHALDLAERYGATLYAIYVVDTARYTEPAFSSTELETTDAEDYGGRELTEVETRAEGLDVEVVSRLCHGLPSEEIVAYADAVDADLITLGYSGQTHRRSGRMGSTADRVVQNAGRPVMVL